VTTRRAAATAAHQPPNSRPSVNSARPKHLPCNAFEAAGLPCGRKHMAKLPRRRHYNEILGGVCDSSDRISREDSSRANAVCWLPAASAQLKEMIAIRAVISRVCSLTQLQTGKGVQGLRGFSERKRKRGCIDSWGASRTTR